MGGNHSGSSTPSHWYYQRESLISFLLALIPVVFNLSHLYPEVAGDLVSGNDSVFHLLVVQMAAIAPCHASSTASIRYASNAIS